YQTAAGFLLPRREEIDWAKEPRTRVGPVEPGSPAERSGLQKGDLIVGVDGGANQVIVEGKKKALQPFLGLLAEKHRDVSTREDEIHGTLVLRVAYSDIADYRDDYDHIYAQLVPDVEIYDTFSNLLVYNCPRGKQSFALTVERGDQQIDLQPFVPR